MPEEKKDSFTFSDKIKSSKPAGNKSFAKSSAKIGRDGKPKATLFERTRRDAPFFIAALVALLLLPFLYKYSGQSGEDQVLAPGMESAEFDPERYGFDTAMIEDPDGQIAQLSGRDSLSLIKGWGSNQEEDYARDDMDLDASGDYNYEGSSEAEGEYAAERHSSSDMDVEENTTNIYKRRARAGTRAAFRRTKIGALGPASLRRPGGSRLGINNWGGGLKGAAKKVGSGPKEAPKPVSLQPLRAAGPARSSFGQGAAQAARRSKDNMGKANAVEALRDSYVKPVDPSRVGGLDAFAMGPGGGAGKLSHSMNIAPGREPWWWDMMKTRMQKEWEERFKRKWGWITFFDDLAKNILKGLINCLITGDDGGDMGVFFGSGGGSGGKEPKCCGVDGSGWQKELAEIGASVLTESNCKTILKKKYGAENYKKACGDNFWEKGQVGGKARVGFFGQRLKCLGFAASGYLSGSTALKSAGLDCADMPLYQVTPSGEARKWNTYIYVTARNYFPDNLKAKFKNDRMPKTGNLLCAQADRKHGGDSLDMTGDPSVGVGHGEVETGSKNAAKEHIVAQNAANADNIPSEQEEIRASMYDLNQEEVQNGCVIYVQRGDTFDYEVFKNKIIDQFEQWSGHKAKKEEAEQAFRQLDLLAVESFAAKDKLAYAAWGESGHQLNDMLPMVYWRFYNAYVRHKKITHKLDGSKDKVYKAKYRVPGVDVVYGPLCYFDNALMVDCKDDMDNPQATVTFKEGYKGTDGKTINPVEEAKNLVVTATFTSLDGKSDTPELNMHHGIELTGAEDKTLIYTLNPEFVKEKTGKIEWKVYRNARTQHEAHQHPAVSTAICTVNLSGDGYTQHVQPKPCTSSQESAKCCDELMGTTPHHWDASKPVGSQCVDDTPAPPTPPTSAKITRLAPVLSWVPSNGKADCREEASESVNPGEKVFAGCPKVSGIVKNQDQNCGSQIPLMMDSEAAAKFVQDVVKQYNAKYPKAEKKFSDKFYANKYPTDGEFVDALFIAKELGIAQVPSSAVCELARDFVRMSKDKHAGNMQVAGSSEDFKNLKRYYRNELGAFLVYVHPASILYPNKYYGKERSVCDWRFLPEGSKCGERKSTMKMGKAYYFNYYNDSKNRASLKAYLASFDEVKIPKTYPLAQLVQGHSSLAHNCPTDNCSDNRNKYNKDEYFGLMISDRDATDGRGEACELFAGKGTTMSVEKALEYVQSACSVGLDAKPYGNQYSDRPGPKTYVSGQTFTRTTPSRPGNDGSTQKQSGGRGRG